MTNSDALILKCSGHTPALDAFLLNELYTERHLASLSLFVLLLFLFFKYISEADCQHNGEETRLDMDFFFFFNASSSVVFIYPNGHYPLR